LSGFASKNKLRQAILALIATQITNESEKKELEKTFESLDKDGNGVLSRNELIDGYLKKSSKIEPPLNKKSTELLLKLT